MSKVVQKLIPTLGYIENMLDILKQVSEREKGIKEDTTTQDVLNSQIYVMAS